MPKKIPISISELARKKAVASIRRYCDENLDLEVGDLKAGLLLDYFLAEHGPAVYNQAIADAQGFLNEQVADLGAICHHDEFPFWDVRKRG